RPVDHCLRSGCNNDPVSCWRSDVSGGIHRHSEQVRAGVMPAFHGSEAEAEAAAAAATMAPRRGSSARRKKSTKERFADQVLDRLKRVWGTDEGEDVVAAHKIPEICQSLKIDFCSEAVLGDADGSDSGESGRAAAAPDCVNYGQLVWILDNMRH